MPAGTYTVRLTKGADTIEEKIDVVVDRRAPYGAAERREQFDAVMKAVALFNDMSSLTDRIDAARGAALRAAKGLAASDALKKKLETAAGELDGVKKKIVATKEGGAVTGEERIREHLDDAYGALMSWEGKPAAYQVARVEALARELAEVSKEFDQVASRDLRPLSEEMKSRKLEPIPLGSAPSRP